MTDQGGGLLYARLDGTGDVYRVASSLLPDLSRNGTETTVSYREYDRYYLHAATSGGGQFLVRRECMTALRDTLREVLP